MPSSVTNSKISTIKTIVTTIGAVATTVKVVRSVAKDHLPPEFRDFIYLGFKKFINKFSTYFTLVIYESDDFKPSEMFKAAELYLSDKISLVTNRLKVSKTPDEKNMLELSSDLNEEFTDTYNGVKFYWSKVSVNKVMKPKKNEDGMSRSLPCELQSLELTFHRQHKDMALNEYLPFILKHAEMKVRDEQIVKLFTLNPNKWYARQAWLPVHLDHPSTFSTLAMDGDVKDMVMKDLDRFLERREFYREVGKVWKRGYLLYGPPGTGKSSLIAAMANYLKFDIYDLELSSIKCNSDLRSILLATQNRSILVVEDIDCSAELHDRVSKNTMKVRDNPSRKSRVTLSGFLNFIDGLWSSCGDERIIIFTTNRKDKLDPALLRPGRMDVHINLSYCTMCGFRLLASNYLGITQHNLFEQIEDLIGKVQITPAEVAEQLLKDDDPDVAFAGLIELLEVKQKNKIIKQAKNAKKGEVLAGKESEEMKQVDNKETELLAEENEVKEQTEIIEI